MAWILPVTDRTEEDVLRRTPKGYCNAADLNRLEGNCLELAGMVGTAITTKSWSRADKPRASDFGRILKNIAALRTALHGYHDTPPTPDNPLNTWEKWNDAEKILEDIQSRYTRIRNDCLRCGEKSVGDRIGVM